jgi:hypothetical protein
LNPFIGSGIGLVTNNKERTLPASVNTSSDRVDLGRRATLLAGAVGLGSLCLSKTSTAEESAERPHPFKSYSELLETLRRRGHTLRTLGLAPDRSPVVAVRAGGEKAPAIFISAGSHSTEHAGVVAAVELIDRLETEHQVWVVPTRDPIGLNGFGYALSLGLMEPPVLENVTDAEAAIGRQSVRIKIRMRSRSSMAPAVLSLRKSP